MLEQYGEIGAVRHVVYERFSASPTSLSASANADMWGCCEYFNSGVVPS
jgi:hypothetical protein